MNFISDDDIEGVTISVRDDPPSHYIFKIQSFSSLQKNSIERYDTGEFESGSHKWKLSLHPNGSKKDKSVKDHISLYLVVADDTSSLPVNWEIIVTFKLFLLDQIHNKYLTIEDDNGRFRRFHGEKTELGFSKLIPLATFNDPSNGYLLDDTCIFGAEVFVIESTDKGERLSMIKDPSPFKHTWKIERFSELTEGSHESEAFNSTDHKWKVRLYIKGKEKNHISLYLVMAESATPIEEVYSRYSLSIKNQMGNQHVENEDCHMFKKLNTGWGWAKFIPLNDLCDEAKGFLVRDTCIIDAEVTVLGLATVFT